MRKYKALNKHEFEFGEYKLTPIRHQDRFDIMKWRNEQIYHLRQSSPLTEEVQDKYFNEVISNLFNQELPNQLLFSFLKNDKFIGYGGLVHINWIDKNAEISFIMDTSLEAEYFDKYWSIYLKIIEKVAFTELDFHKIYTYAFDIRPHLYEVLEFARFSDKVILREHCFYNNKFLDVIIHSKFNSELFKDELDLRDANYNDAEILFKWANDSDVRKNAKSNEIIKWENHLIWLNEKINNSNTKIFILYCKEKLIGQIRIDKIQEYWVIDYSIDFKYRGLGLGKKIVELLLNRFKNYKFKAIVKRENEFSIKVFKNLGFEQCLIENDDFLQFEINSN